MISLWVRKKGIVAEDRISEIINENLKQGYIFIAIYTNEVKCEKYIETISDIPHLLEIRIFNESTELKAIRTAMGKDFIWRIADDEYFAEQLKNVDDDFENKIKNRVLIEKQYLDIDEKKTKELAENTYITTGGGEFTVPLNEAKKVIIKNYINYDEQGILKITDFRIVGFETEGGAK